jgi:hypothetical protein
MELIQVYEIERMKERKSLILGCRVLGIYLYRYVDFFSLKLLPN